jgi:diguanylate cyclase (GGDEF)-like protein/PAS domain S-box-containing protein
MTSNSSKSTKIRKYDTLLKIISKGTKKNSDSLKKVMPFTTKLEKLREEIRLLTSYSSDTVYRLRYDSMTYDYVSPAIVKLLGFSPDEMIKINFRSLILETKIISNGIISVSSFNELEKSRKNGDVNKWQADYLIKTKDGRQIWLTDISYPWFDDSGKIVGSIGSLRDISDRIKAEEHSKEELIRLAHTDILTGLANRRTFFEAVDKELKRTIRSENNFSILLIDIDFFKKINDTYGHTMGDKVLTDLGQVMKTCIRDTDLLARVGGEEFAVFLPDTSEGGAYWVADRICTSVAKHNFFIKDSIMPINCTVSIGISSNDSNLEISSTELYKQADTRLYIAKNTGRNQVSMDEIVQLH